MSLLTAVILTFNEEKHIARAIASVVGIAGRVVVVDCGSTDATTEIATRLGAQVLTNPWINYATQFNWALDHLPQDTVWVLRLDADETVTDTLQAQIKIGLELLTQTIVGVYVSRRMAFLGRVIRHGGVFPVRVLRLFRHGHGRCENRWMDEHIVVAGPTADFPGEILDDNLNPLNRWTEKHNTYASREVIDILNLDYQFMPHETIASLRSGRQAAIKRWIKERAYSQLPRGLRAMVYFLYRYVLRLGFLDGFEGTAFHILQGFWYRFLVDAKLYEVRRHMERTGADAPSAISTVLNIQLPIVQVDGSRK